MYDPDLPITQQQKEVISTFVVTAIISSNTQGAKARCQAMGKQLPEIYDEYSMQTLSLLMRNKKVSTVWAGIQFDPNTAIQRFISTGMPIYRGFSKLQVYHQGKSTSMRLLFDDSHASSSQANQRSRSIEPTS